MLEFKKNYKNYKDMKFFKSLSLGVCYDRNEENKVVVGAVFRNASCFCCSKNVFQHHAKDERKFSTCIHEFSFRIFGIFTRVNFAKKKFF